MDKLTMRKINEDQKGRTQESHRKQPTSKIAQHANECGHEFDFDNMAIVDSEENYHKRLFLEAWYSNKDKRSRNDCVKIPDVYKSLFRKSDICARCYLIRT